MRRSTVVVCLFALLTGCGDDTSSAPGKDGGQDLRSDSKTDQSLPCAVGCVDTKGVCQQGTENGACGSAGNVCDVCTATQTCNAGACQEVCNKDTCPNGCCDGNTCVTTPSTSQCGANGAACSACSGTDVCVAGQCVPPKDCSSCPGCCLEGQCLSGQKHNACGSGGATCIACKQTETCESGQCKPATCDATTCPNGCCNANNQCEIFGQQSLQSCGKAGEACRACGAGDVSCQQGQCIKDQPCLSYCTSGCCTSTGKCIDFSQQDPNRCGAAKTQCAACTNNAVACLSGQCVTDPSWEVWVVSAVVPAKNNKGNDWDIFCAGTSCELPDPYAGVTLAGSTFLHGFTRTITNTLTPFWDEKVKTYKESELTSKSITVEVRDSDTGLFNHIGSCTFAITAADLAAGTKSKPSCSLQIKLKFVKK